jgi:hypothetical protein
MSFSAEAVVTEGFVTSKLAQSTLSLVISTLAGTVFAKSASSDVVDEAGCGATRSTVVAESVMDCCAVVQVKIVNPDSVVAADVPRPMDSRLSGVVLRVALGLAAGVFFFVVVIVCLPM